MLLKSGQNMSFICLRCISGFAWTDLARFQPLFTTFPLESFISHNILIMRTLYRALCILWGTWNNED